MSKVELLTYMGERADGAGKISQVFLWRDNPVHFSRLKSVWLQIGENYEGTVDKDGNLTMKVRPDHAGASHHTEEQIEVWRLEEEAAHALRRRKATAKRFNKSKSLEQIASIFKPMLKGLSYSDVQVLIQAAVDEALRERKADERRKTEAMLRRMGKKLNKALKEKK